MFIIFYVVCVFIRVSVGTLVMWHVYRGQRTASGVCVFQVVWDKVFVVSYTRLTGP